VSDGVGIAPPGYRLPAVTRIGRVVLQVGDLERSLRYYRDVIGLGVLERQGGRAVLGGPDRHPLVELRERPGVAPVGRRARLGLFHFAILLPDRAALGRFLGHLSRLGVRAGMSDHLVSEALYLYDPDGLGIEVYADRPRHTWRAAEGQLVMATEPMETGAVLAAGGEAPWSGVPTGTVMGHIHLCVGDLDQARDFYHRGLGFDVTVWNYPGALFMSAGGYHHHLGTNIWAAGAPPAGRDEARLIEWELVVPAAADAAQALDSVRQGGGVVEDGVARDPWGTAVRVANGE